MPVLLIGSDERKLIKSILTAAARGFLSDPVGINLFEPTVRGADGLQQYKCLRGSNTVETWHRWLISAFDKQTIVGPHFGHVLMVSFQYLYSIRNGRRNGVVPDFGHNDLTLEQKSQCYSAKASGGQFIEHHDWAPKHGAWKPNGGTIDDNASPQDFGLVGIQRYPGSAADLYDASQVQDSSQLSPSLKFYANKQQLSVPILPLHGGKEFKLFAKLLQSHGGTGADLDYDAILSQWRTNVDGVHIFPKLLCHLRRAYKLWESIAAAKEARKHVNFADVKAFLKRCNDAFDASYFNFILEQTASISEAADAFSLAELVDESLRASIGEERPAQQQLQGQQEQAQGPRRRRRPDGQHPNVMPRAKRRCVDPRCALYPSLHRKGSNTDFFIVALPEQKPGACGVDVRCAGPQATKRN